MSTVKEERDFSVFRTPPGFLKLDEKTKAQLPLWRSYACQCGGLDFWVDVDRDREYARIICASCDSPQGIVFLLKPMPKELASTFGRCSICKTRFKTQKERDEHFRTKHLRNSRVIG